MKKIELQSRVKELEWKLKAMEAQLVHNYHFAHAQIGQASIAKMLGSAVILEITFLGGKGAIPPVAIKDGLSDETIAAIKADLVRSYEAATLFKPAGAN